MTCPEAPCCPTPTCNPKEDASFLPGCCLSPLSFPSRSRKRCHPGLCRTPPAFLFLAQELASSFPWLAALAPQLAQSSRGRRRTEVREARVHTSSSLCCQQPWAVETQESATGSWLWEQHTGLLGEG